MCVICYHCQTEVGAQIKKKSQAQILQEKLKSEKSKRKLHKKK